MPVIDWAVVGTEIFKGFIAIFTGSLVAWLTYRFQTRSTEKVNLGQTNQPNPPSRVTQSGIVAKPFSIPIRSSTGGVDTTIGSLVVKSESESEPSESKDIDIMELDDSEYVERYLKLIEDSISDGLSALRTIRLVGEPSKVELGGAKKLSEAEVLELVEKLKTVDLAKIVLEQPVRIVRPRRYIYIAAALGLIAAVLMMIFLSQVF